MPRSGPSTGEQHLLNQARAIGRPRRPRPQAVGHTHKRLGQGDGIGLEIADGFEVLAGHTRPLMMHQGVERQDGTDGGDAVRCEGRSRGQGPAVGPANCPVTACAAPDPVAVAIEHIEGLSEQQLIDAIRSRIGTFLDIDNGHRAVHGAERPIGRTAHKPFQPQLGQVGPGEHGARIKGCGNGQAMARAVGPALSHTKPKAPLTGLFFLAGYRGYQAPGLSIPGLDISTG